MVLRLLTWVPSQGGTSNPEKNIFLHSLICHTSDMVNGDAVLEDPSALKGKLPFAPLEPGAEPNAWPNAADHADSLRAPTPLYAGEGGKYDRSPFPELDK